MLQRFDNLFLRDFRDPITMQSKAIAAITEETLPPPPPPPPTFSEAELENAQLAAKEQGYTEGFAAATQQARTETAAREKDMATALAQIVQHFQKLEQQQQSYMAQQTSEVSELALLIAKKAAEDALDARGAEVITALVKQCLPLFLDKVKVSIELHPATLDNAKATLDTLLAQHGFNGAVQYRANEALNKHDARVDWGNGQATRSMETLWQEIETLIFQTKPH